MKCDFTPLLKEKTRLALQVNSKNLNLKKKPIILKIHSNYFIFYQLERNLHKELVFHEDVPDMKISAKLSSIHCKLHPEQYWSIRGVLACNLGEPIPDFIQPSANLQAPQTNVCFACFCWACIVFQVFFVVWCDNIFFLQFFKLGFTWDKEVAN